MRLAWGLLILVFVVSACTSEPAPEQRPTTTNPTSVKTENDAEKIRQTFDAVVTAVNNKDSAAALPLFSDNSFEYFDSLRKHALTSTEDQVSKLPLGQRTNIYGLRAVEDKNLVRHGTPQELVGDSIRQGGITLYAFTKRTAADGTVIETSKIKPVLTELDIRGDYATAKMPGYPTTYTFHRVGEGWKIDLAAWLASGGLRMVEAAQAQGLTEEQYITLTLVNAFGEARAAELRLPIDRYRR